MNEKMIDNAIGKMKFGRRTVEVNMTFYRSVSEAIRSNGVVNVQDLEAELEKTLIDYKRQEEKHGRLRPFDLSEGVETDHVNVTVKAAFSRIRIRDWSISDLAGFLSDDFMSTLVSGHFHVDLSNAGGPSDEGAEVVVNGKKFVIPSAAYYADKFNMHARQEASMAGRSDKLIANPDGQDSQRLASIDGIECTIFNSGYVALVIRFVNESDISGEELLELIKRPDQLAKLQGANLGSLYSSSVAEKPLKLDCGLLNVVGYAIAQKLTFAIKQCLNGMTLQFWHFEEADSGVGGQGWNDKVGFNEGDRPPWSQWSRPYVGVVMPDDEKLSLYFQNNVSMKDLHRFVISIGRTTPEFLNTFVDPDRYLDSGNRNVYGDGGSMVFIAARGWCVWNGANQGKLLFRLGVVEMAHFVAMAVECSIRSRRRFFHYVRATGGDKVRELNLALRVRTENARYTRDLLRDAVRPKKIKGLFSRDKVIKSMFWAVGRRLKIISNNRTTHRVLRAKITDASGFIGDAYVAAPFDDGVAILEAHLKTHTARATAARYKALKSFSQADESSRSTLRHYVDSANSIQSYMHSSTNLVSNRTLIVAVASVAISIFALRFLR